MSTTSKGRKYNYEVMFLLGQAQSAQMGDTLAHINDLFKRANVELIAMKKWDERRLAYEIEKNKRGTYILAYFSADPVNIIGFERDCNLSEKIMRVLITRCDHLSMDEMKAADARQDLATEAQLRTGTPETATA
jgi:small subunit ribosomal protein S6